ncbi:hypothetical protein K440DRAFT_587008, partial [Wilcoxina mikolae CBS 423.85]
MVDPLSTAASIAGLISLAQMVVKEGYGYISTAVGCPGELSDLVREVTTLTGLLSTVGVIVGDEHHATVSLGLSDIRKTLNDILELLSRFKTREGKSVRNLGKKLLWPLVADESRELFDRIDRHKNTLQIALSADTLSQVNALRCELRNDQSRAEEDRKIQQSVDHRKKVLKFLSSAVDHEARHKDIRDKRHENTGRWFFQKDAYQQWLKGPDFVLWCHGIPGAGKTFLASIIIDELTQGLSGDDVAVAYIYCNHKDNETKTADNMIANLLKQLLAHQNPACHASIETLYEHFVKEDKSPTLADMQGIIITTAKGFKQIYIILDALDECDEDNQRDKIISFVEHISQRPFKVIVTSRPHPRDIQHAFGTELQVEILATADDMEAVIRNKISQKAARGSRINPQLANDIVKVLLEQAEGMFLLVNFQVDHILRQPTPKKQRQALLGIPKDLNATYDLAMEKIYRLDDTQKQLALDVLIWIVNATRPLRFPELQLAVAIEDGDFEVDEEALADPDTIIDLCASLVVLEKETQGVRLVHYTVQKYLES